MNYKKFVKKQNKKFIKGFEQKNDYRKQWSSLEKRINKIYSPLLEELKNDFHFEFFYLKSRKDFTSNKSNTNQNFIQFFMGNHMVGILNEERDNVSGKIKSNLITESGGALLFSQGPQGEVLVAVYPCKSDVFKYEDDHIVYKIYKNPCRITEEKLIKIVKFYFRFMYMSSYVGNINIFDRLKILWIKFRVGFDILKFGKSIFGALKASIEIVSGVKGIKGS